MWCSSACSLRDSHSAWIDLTLTHPNVVHPENAKLVFFFSQMHKHTVKLGSEAACRAAPQSVHPYSTQRTNVLGRRTHFSCMQRTGILTNFWRTHSPQFTALVNGLLQTYLKIYLLPYAHSFLLKDAVQMKGVIHVSFSVNSFFFSVFPNAFLMVCYSSKPKIQYVKMLLKRRINF